ncbi:12195_t:CDS:10 [Ambispora gerdemannii]|uniref:U3 small nucleolar RNA-associated protein 25 n=1 Tax=Ambispora gerdemannii TaxID=144530 RepID=A0A9N8ZQ71_9GLOM|nr:12195_t:CDS:10 [Ambispora gerdemannii]
MEVKRSSYNKLIELLQKDAKIQKPIKRRKLAKDTYSVDKSLFQQEEYSANKETAKTSIVHTEEVKKAKPEEISLKTENNKLSNSDSEEEEDYQDNYEQHYGDHDPNSLKNLISIVETKAWNVTNYEDPSLKLVSKSMTNDDCKESPIITHLNPSKIKKRIFESWTKLDENGEYLTELQSGFLHQFLQYRDILYTNRNIKDAREIRHIYALHVLNHVFIGRDHIIKNNAKIARAQATNKEINEIRDQGFTRPKVLILLPFKNSALDLVKILITLSGSQQQENRKRFFEEFDIPKEEETINPNKPADFLATFQGNIDDSFRIGIKFTRKTMKLYADFYSADIIIASPLGLRIIIGAEGDKKRDFDFLSSIELLIIDQCDTLLMQNWDHVEHIFDHLNLIPKEHHDCDFARVKNWYLDGNAKYLRQTLLFADYLTPEMNALYNTYLFNIAGKLKIKHLHQGSILDVIPQVQQIFIRIESSSLLDAGDARFKYFTEKTLPSLRKSAIINQAHTMIFISSYFDFVRLRNYFEDNAYSFASLCEYTPSPDVKRARAHFSNGKRDFLLYTERLHFFRRYQIRGVRHIVFYDLPDHPHFYSELLNLLSTTMGGSTSKSMASDMLTDDNLFSCQILFSKYDHLKLERIVGSNRVNRMLNANKNIFILS